MPNALPEGFALQMSEWCTPWLGKAQAKTSKADLHLLLKAHLIRGIYLGNLPLYRIKPHIHRPVHGPAMPLAITSSHRIPKGANPLHPLIHSVHPQRPSTAPFASVELAICEATEWT